MMRTHHLMQEKSSWLSTFPIVHALAMSLRVPIHHPTTYSRPLKLAKLERVLLLCVQSSLHLTRHGKSVIDFPSFANV